MPMDADDVVFYAEEELPSARPHHRSRYHEFAALLRQNLGLWAAYPGALTSPASRAHAINNDDFGSLPCSQFEAQVRENVLYVRYWPDELREQPSWRHFSPIPPPDHSTADWARLLFDRVGPERADVVFRVLSRVLHPDNAIGDVALQQELSDARKRLR